MILGMSTDAFLTFHVIVSLIGVASGVTAVFLPAASEAVMYVLMAVVLLIRPRGLLGEEGMLT